MNRILVFMFCLIVCDSRAAELKSDPAFFTTRLDLVFGPGVMFEILPDSKDVEAAFGLSLGAERSTVMTKLMNKLGRSDGTVLVADDRSSKMTFYIIGQSRISPKIWTRHEYSFVFDGNRLQRIVVNQQEGPPQIVCILAQTRT